MNRQRKMMLAWTLVDYCQDSSNSDVYIIKQVTERYAHVQVIGDTECEISAIGSYVLSPCDSEHIERRDV